MKRSHAVPEPKVLPEIMILRYVNKPISLSTLADATVGHFPAVCMLCVERHKRATVFKDHLACWLKDVIVHIYLNACQVMPPFIKCCSACAMSPLGWH